MSYQTLECKLHEGRDLTLVQCSTLSHAKPPSPPALPRNHPQKARSCLRCRPSASLNFSELPFQDFCPGQMESHIVSMVTLSILPPCILMIFLQDSYMPTKAQISHFLLRRAFYLVLFSGP